MLNETPYSMYLTVTKKFTKEHTQAQSTQLASKPNNNVVDITKYADILTKLHDKISNHIQTKQELSQREIELSLSVDANNANIEDSRIEYFRQRETITKLPDELAQEVDEHAQAEAALRKLEDKVDNLQSELNRVSKNSEDLSEEKETLCERLEDAEQEIDTSNKMIKTLNVKLLHNEKSTTNSHLWTNLY